MVCFPLEVSDMCLHPKPYTMNKENVIFFSCRIQLFHDMKNGKSFVKSFMEIF